MCGNGLMYMENWRLIPSSWGYGGGARRGKHIGIAKSSVVARVVEWSNWGPKYHQFFKIYNHKMQSKSFGELSKARTFP